MLPSQSSESSHCRNICYDATDRVWPCVFCLQSAWHGLCVCHHRGSGHRPRAERTNKGIHSSNHLPSAIRACAHAEMASLSREGRCVCVCVINRVMLSCQHFVSYFLCSFITDPTSSRSAQASTAASSYFSQPSSFVFSKLLAAHLTPDWTIRSIRCRSCCQLHQHPTDETEVTSTNAHYSVRGALMWYWCQIKLDVSFNIS